MTLLTEEEAKAKWCPLDKLSHSDRHIGGPKPFCIGSACMAWRWGYEPNPNYSHHMATTEPSTVRSETHGYCGAFGECAP